MPQQTATDYGKVIRFTKAIHSTRPAWDDSKDKDVDNFVQRFKREFPWPVTFHKVPKDDLKRTEFTDLQEVSELMKEMEGRHDGG